MIYTPPPHLKTSFSLHIASVERQPPQCMAVSADTEAFGSLYKLPTASNKIKKKKSSGGACCLPLTVGNAAYVFAKASAATN